MSPAAAATATASTTARSTMPPASRRCWKWRAPPRRRPTSRAAPCMFLATTARRRVCWARTTTRGIPTVPIAQIVGNVDLDMPLLLYPFTDVIAFGAESFDHRQTGGGGRGADEHQAVAGSHARAGRVHALGPLPVRAPGSAGGVPRDRDRQRRRRRPGANSWTAPITARGDDLSQTIDWKAGASLRRPTTASPVPWPTADAPPLWYAGDYFGDTFAPKAARAPR